LAHPGNNKGRAYGSPFIFVFASFANRLAKYFSLTFRLYFQKFNTGESVPHNFNEEGSPIKVGITTQITELFE